MESTAIAIATATAAPASLRVIVERGALESAVAFIAGRIVERRNTVPIVSNVMLAATAAGALRIVGTDLDMVAETTIEAAWDSPGETTVTAHVLADALKRMTGETVTLELRGHQLAIQPENGAATLLPTLPVDDFPVLAFGALPCAFEQPARRFADDLETVFGAVSYEETRYYLNGIFCHLYRPGAPDMALRMVATDGHRMILADREAPESIVPRAATDDAPAFAGLEDIIIPRKTVATLLKLIGNKGGGVVEIAASRTKIRFRYGRTVIYSKLIDGTFPDYTRVIPTQNSKPVTVDARSLAASIKGVTAISSEKCRAIALTAHWDQVVLRCTSPENGSATDGIHADGTSGEPTSIGFNAKYLSDLAAWGGNLTLTLEDASAPVLVRSDALPHVTGVLMPMRVDSSPMERLDPSQLSSAPIGKAKRKPVLVEPTAAAAPGAPVGGAEIMALRATVAELAGQIAAMRSERAEATPAAQAAAAREMVAADIIEPMQLDGGTADRIAYLERCVAEANARADRAETDRRDALDIARMEGLRADRAEAAADHARGRIAVMRDRMRRVIGLARLEGLAHAELRSRTTALTSALSAIMPAAPAAKPVRHLRSVA